MRPYRRPHARRETTPGPGPQAVRLLAPPAPARSCYARATDDRTTPARALLGKANGRGLGAQKGAPLTPCTSRGVGTGSVHRNHHRCGSATRSARAGRTAATGHRSACRDVLAHRSRWHGCGGHPRSWHGSARLPLDRSDRAASPGRLIGVTRTAWQAVRFPDALVPVTEGVSPQGCTAVRGAKDPNYTGKGGHMRPDQRTATDHTIAGFDTSGSRQRDRLASTFRSDERMEEILSWQTSDPARFDQIPTQVRVAVGLYAGAKAAAEQVAAEQAALAPE